MSIKFSISAHAAQRWVQRVDPSATIQEAREAIYAKARCIEAAIAIGCQVVRLPGSQRLVIDCVNRRVVTVTPPQPQARSRQHPGKRIDWRAHKRIRYDD